MKLAFGPDSVQCQQPHGIGCRLDGHLVSKRLELAHQVAAADLGVVSSVEHVGAKVLVVTPVVQ